MLLRACYHLDFISQDVLVQLQDLVSFWFLQLFGTLGVKNTLMFIPTPNRNLRILRQKLTLCSEKPIAMSVVA